jgi:hypothetical protein
MLRSSLSRLHMRTRTMIIVSLRSLAKIARVRLTTRVSFPMVSSLALRRGYVTDSVVEDGYKTPGEHVQSVQVVKVC